jgi:hypothetical protein
MTNELNIEASPWPTEAIIPFLKAQGHTVVRTPEGWWYDHYRGAHLFIPLPLQRSPPAVASEAESVFRDAKAAWWLRCAGAPSPNQDSSFRWILKRPYDLTTLSSNIRHNVRRGLARTVTRPMTFREVVQLGAEAHGDTIRRHGGKPHGLGVELELDECGAFEAWGAFVGDELAAFAVTVIMDDWAHFLVVRSTDKHMKLYPNNALLFYVCQQLLQRNYVSTICRGFRSVKAPAGLENYNKSMGFVPEPIDESILLRPPLGLLINRFTCAAAKPILHLLGQQGIARVLAAVTK